MSRSRRARDEGWSNDQGEKMVLGIADRGCMAEDKSRLPQSTQQVVGVGYQGHIADIPSRPGLC